MLLSRVFVSTLDRSPSCSMATSGSFLNGSMENWFEAVLRAFASNGTQ